MQSRLKFHHGSNHQTAPKSPGSILFAIKATKVHKQKQKQMTTDMKSVGNRVKRVFAPLLTLTQFYLEIITMTPSLLYQTRRKNPLVYNGLIWPDFFLVDLQHFFFRFRVGGGGGGGDKKLTGHFQSFFSFSEFFCSFFFNISRKNSKLVYQQSVLNL